MNTLDYQHIFHEIKNTVTLINSSIQLMDKKCPTLQTEPYWENIKSETAYLKKMVLEISTAGNTDQLQIEPVDINAIINKLCQCMKDTFPKLQWDLRLCGQNPIVNADSTKLRQAILNLMKNSAEAQNGFGTVTIHTRTEDSRVLISITDHGGGIPEKLKDTVFDLFTTSKQHGTGLGLAITKHIVECHHGFLELVNHPASGCTFTICLPMP